MSIHKQYKLEFGKINHGDSSEFLCYTQDDNFRRLSEKIRIMHKVECEGLIEEIDFAQNGEYFEQFFSIDNSAASDDDGIEIAPPNIIIDSTINIPMQDMKAILQEWLNYRNGA